MMVLLPWYLPSRRSFSPSPPLCDFLGVLSKLVVFFSICIEGRLILGSFPFRQTDAAGSWCFPIGNSEIWQLLDCIWRCLFAVPICSLFDATRIREVVQEETIFWGRKRFLWAAQHASVKQVCDLEMPTLSAGLGPKWLQSPRMPRKKHPGLIWQSFSRWVVFGRIHCKELVQPSPYTKVKIRARSAAHSLQTIQPR